MDCPSPLRWTLQHVTSTYDTAAAQVLKDIRVVLILLPLCSALEGPLLSWNWDIRPDLCCCNSCDWQELYCIASALGRLWANS